MKKFLSLCMVLIVALCLLTVSTSAQEKNERKMVTDSTSESYDEVSKCGVNLAGLELVREKALSKASALYDSQPGYLYGIAPYDGATVAKGNRLYVNFKICDTWKYYYTRALVGIYDSSGTCVYATRSSDNHVALTGWTTISDYLDWDTSNVSAGRYEFMVFAQPVYSDGTMVSGSTSWNNIPYIKTYFYVEDDSIDISRCNISLSATTFAYNGNTKTPKVSVKDGEISLGKGVDYTVSYSSGRTKVGTYKVKIKGKGQYYGSVTKYFKIIPKSTTIRSVTSDYNEIIVKWKSQKIQTSGYQVEISRYSNFSSSKKYKVKVSKTGTRIINLTSYKTYYVRVRTYKNIGSKVYYSKWSKKQSVYVW